MGHYRSEMVCNNCGNSPCTCPREPKKINNNWIVENYSPIQIHEFDKKYAVIQTKFGPTNGMPTIRRMGRLEFEKMEGAHQHAIELCEADIATHLQIVADLKNILKRLKEEQ